MSLTQEGWIALAAPFPASAINQKPKKNKSTGQTTWLDYIGHAEVTERFNSVDPYWSWEPYAVDDDGGPLVRQNGETLELWINLTIGGVTRPGVGTVDTGAWSGETAKELISDALRNAGMRFGVGLDLWKKHDSIGTPPAQGQGAPTQAAQSSGSGVAAAVTNRAGRITSPTADVLISEGQSKNLWRLRKYVLKLTDEEYIEAILIGCGREDITDDRVLTSREAGMVISYLKAQAGEEDTQTRPARNEEPPVDDSLFAGDDSLNEPF